MPAPSAVNDTSSTDQNTPVTINVLANDQGAGLTVTGVTIDPSLGQAAINGDGTITFTPSANFASLSLGETGDAIFNYTVTDSAGATSTAAVDVSILGLNDPPVANPDAATVADRASVTINVLGNDTDVDHLHVLNVVGFTQPASGATLQLVNGEFVYNADVATFDSLGAGQTYTDTFSYTVADDWGATSTTTVTVTVTGNAVPGETLTGTNHNDALTGGSGNDWISSGNGKDTIDGAAGSDTLIGGNGNDVIHGGDGNDHINNYVEDESQQDHGDDGEHDDSHGQGDDEHSSDSHGGEGDHGDHGDEREIRGHGDDLIVTGGEGRDTIDGGAGNDTISGGHSHDLFVFGVGFGDDVITDFDRHNDHIQFDHNELGSFGDLMSHATQVGCDVVITTDLGDATLTLWNTSLNDLKESNFIFS